MATLVDIAPAPPALEATVRAALDRVVATIDHALESPRPEVQTLANHALRYRGKMFRPALAIVAASAALPDFDEHHPRFDEVAHAAAVIEIIHLATLIHDDVLDLAEARRGQPSVNALTSNETAIILGDYLFAKSFHLCSKLPVRHHQGLHTATRVGEITAKVCTGELTQLTNRHNTNLSPDTYFTIIQEKTGELIAAACELGARHAGADENTTNALATFGLRVGTAFQIRDDLLDLTGQTNTVGKPLGRDIQLGKLTLPLIHHLAAANGHASTLRDALQNPRDLKGPLAGDDARARLAEQLEQTGSIQHATHAAQHNITLAKQALTALHPSHARDYLDQLADAVIERPA